MPLLNMPTHSNHTATQTRHRVNTDTKRTGTASAKVIVRPWHIVDSSMKHTAYRLLHPALDVRKRVYVAESTIQTSNVLPTPAANADYRPHPALLTRSDDKALDLACLAKGKRCLEMGNIATGSTAQSLLAHMPRRASIERTSNVIWTIDMVVLP